MQQRRYMTNFPCTALEDIPQGSLVCVDDTGEGLVLADDDADVLGVCDYPAKEGERAAVVEAGVTCVRIANTEDTAIPVGAAVTSSSTAGVAEINGEGQIIGRVVSSVLAGGTNAAGQHLVDCGITIIPTVEEDNGQP